MTTPSFRASPPEAGETRNPDPPQADPFASRSTNTDPGVAGPTTAPHPPLDSRLRGMTTPSFRRARPERRHRIQIRRRRTPSPLAARTRTRVWQDPLPRPTAPLDSRLRGKTTYLAAPSMPAFARIPAMHIGWTCTPPAISSCRRRCGEAEAASGLHPSEQRNGTCTRAYQRPPKTCLGAQEQYGGGLHQDVRRPDARLLRDAR